MTKREALKLLDGLSVHWSTQEAALKLRAYLDSLPPDPFVLPPTGTEFTVRVKGVIRTFYHSRGGIVVNVENEGHARCSGFTLEWFNAAGAEIVEEA